MKLKMRLEPIQVLEQNQEAAHQPAGGHASAHSLEFGSWRQCEKCRNTVCPKVLGRLLVQKRVEKWVQKWVPQWVQG